MKKSFLLFSICLFLLSFRTNAQININITPYIEGGINLATVDYTNQSIFQGNSIENRTGFYVGLIPKISLGEKIFLNLETQYSLEGYKVGGDLYEAKFHYIRVLPQLEIKLVKALGIYGGYNLGFNITEQIKENNGSFFKPVVSTIKRTDNGFTVGARVYIGKFTLTGKYNFGFQNITDLNYTELEWGVLYFKY